MATLQTDFDRAMGYAPFSTIPIPLCPKCHKVYYARIIVGNTFGVVIQCNCCKFALANEGEDEGDGWAAVVIPRQSPSKDFRDNIIEARRKVESMWREKCERERKNYGNATEST